MAEIAVEVVYALPERQALLRLSVPAGTSAREAVLLSGIDEAFPGLDVQGCPLGIFGKLLARPEERMLEAGERVEIYRPLIADPKEVRKQRAARARSEREGG
ncbi:RnfH family protein [Pseudomonas aeruginosa]|nr:RnfH family protein [Pseudomonas aeruginosa]MCT0538266.1 RnfH family protein [Pseudomonas aeruginosa]